MLSMTSSPCTRVVQLENPKTHFTTVNATATHKCRCDVAVLPQSAAGAIRNNEFKISDIWF